MYRGDLAGTGYSPVAEITPANASALTRQWTYSLLPDPAVTETAEAAARGPNSQATPIVVNDVMYLPAGNRVVALEPESGREVWLRIPVKPATQSGESGHPVGAKRRWGFHDVSGGRFESM